MEIYNNLFEKKSRLHRHLRYNHDKAKVGDLYQSAAFPTALSWIVLLDFSLTVKAATLIFISGRGSAISSTKEGKSGFIYNLVKS